MNPPKYIRNLALAGLIVQLAGVGFASWGVVLGVSNGSPWRVLISGILLVINACLVPIHIRNLKTYYDY